MFCDAVEAEIVGTMGAVGTLTTLVLLGSFLVLACVDTEVVFVDQVDAEDTVDGVTDGAAVAAIDLGYDA